MSLPKFRRFYFPGLISLIFLPVLCMGYLIENNTFYKPRGMKIAWCDTKWFKKWHVATFRRYDTLNITGNSNHDIPVIKDLCNRVSQLVAKDDLKNGVLVEFGDKSNYAEFINVLDICFLKSEKGMWFAPYRNRLYIGHVHPATASASKYKFWGNDVVYNDVPKPVPDFFDNLKSLSLKILRFSESYWAPELAFALMLFFTFNKRKRLLDLTRFRLTGY